jgi:hypothetical protein
MSDRYDESIFDEWFLSEVRDVCSFPGWCVMGASPHLPHECLHVDDAARYYEMIEQEFSSTEEVSDEP